MPVAQPALLCSMCRWCGSRPSNKAARHKRIAALTDGSRRRPHVGVQAVYIVVEVVRVVADAECVHPDVSVPCQMQAQRYAAGGAAAAACLPSRTTIERHAAALLDN